MTKINKSLKIFKKIVKILKNLQNISKDDENMTICLKIGKCVKI